MFGRIYVYKFKELIRNRYVVGWNIMFPLVLATAFYLGFGNLISDDPDNFKTINVGYVNTNQAESNFETVLDELTEETDGNEAILSLRKYGSNQEETNFSKMLDELSKTTDSHEQVVEVHEYASKDDSLKGMTEGAISGIYIEKDGEIETIVPKNGYESTTLNQIAREYENMLTLIETVAKDHPENIQTAIDMMTNDL